MDFLGDLSATAERTWIALVSGGDAAVAESVARKIAELKKDLAGLRPTALERLAADHLAVCRLAEHAAQLGEAGTTGGSPAQELMRMKRVESAQRRLLNAVRLQHLARLAVPQDTGAEAIRIRERKLRTA